MKKSEKTMNQLFDESISKGYDFAEIEFETEPPSLPQWRRTEVLEQKKQKRFKFGTQMRKELCGTIAVKPAAKNLE